MADPADSMAPSQGTLQWIIALGIAVATGVGSALGLNARVAKLEKRVEALEEAKAAHEGAAIRDELLAKVRELASEFRQEIDGLRRDLTERPAETLSSTVQGLVDARIGAAVTKAVADASEKHLERLMALSDRVSLISGEIKSALSSGGKR